MAASYYSDRDNGRHKSFDIDDEYHDEDVPFLDLPSGSEATDSVNANSNIRDPNEQDQHAQSKIQDEPSSAAAAEAETETPAGSGGATTSSALESQKVRTRLTVTLFFIILSVELGAGMTSGPITRILESIACRQFYLETDASKVGADGQVAENMCKMKEVQTELAAVRGYMEFFDGLLSMLVCLFVVVAASTADHLLPS